ncbi:hypothetical protein ACFYWU_37640 [Streptomyces chrestomyceticus]|uniref:hypothetical protein n=1 Tax=Streptomyces chrestomyceticus TaxID=68185 RepID=UPI0036CB5ACA
MYHLKDKTAAVTGGGTGTGLATAARPPAEDAHVFTTGRHTAEPDTAVETIGTARATATAEDTSDPPDPHQPHHTVPTRGQGPGRGPDVTSANATAASPAPPEQTTEEDLAPVFGHDHPTSPVPRPSAASARPASRPSAPGCWATPSSSPVPRRRRHSGNGAAAWPTCTD